MARRWQFVKQLIGELVDSRLENGAAALAFYSVLALFPAAIFGLTLLPYLPIPNLQQAVFDLLGELMPREAGELFNGTVKRIMSERHEGLLSFGLLFAIWSATSGVLAVMEQLDVVQRAKHARSALRARGVAFLLLLPLSALTVVAFGLVVFGGVLQDWLIEHVLGSSGLLLTCFACFRWLVIVFALLSATAFLYRMGPTQGRPFRLLSPGRSSRHSVSCWRRSAFDSMSAGSEATMRSTVASARRSRCWFGCSSQAGYSSWARRTISS